MLYRHLLQEEFRSKQRRQRAIWTVGETSEDFLSFCILVTQKPCLAAGYPRCDVFFFLYSHNAF